MILTLAQVFAIALTLEQDREWCEAHNQRSTAFLIEEAVDNVLAGTPRVGDKEWVEQTLREAARRAA